MNDEKKPTKAGGKPRRKRVEARARSTNYQHRHRALGLCGKCPEPAGINPHTGKHYLHCAVHRQKIAARMKLKMRQRRQA